MQKLIAWKNKETRLPLVLFGARQVGKTWLLREFGRSVYQDVLYVDFEHAQGLGEAFAGDISPHKILDLLSALYGKRIIPRETLLIFDEVQVVPQVFEALACFPAEARDIDICCASSLPGSAIGCNAVFPCDKVETLTLRPLSFEEYLTACGGGALISYVKSEGMNEIPQVIVDKLCDHLKHYFIVGGMPAAVAAWLDTGDYARVELCQRDILAAIDNDFSIYASGCASSKLRSLWDCVPSQLAKENKKYVYCLVKEGARARDYGDAMLWLLGSRLVCKIYRAVNITPPLSECEDAKAFKLYHLDVGLLRLAMGVRPEAVLEDARIFSEYNEALSEQFVVSELSGMDFVQDIAYWTSEATAEVDFVFSMDDDVYPLEVNTEVCLQAKSLKVYRERYQPRLSIRVSMSKLRLDCMLLNVPLYMLFNLGSYLKKILDGEGKKV